MAELTSEITASCSKGEDWGAWQEVIERFLFDGVDAEAGTTAVGIEDHLSVAIFADEAKAFIAGVEVAVSRAELAEDFLGLWVERGPPLSGDCTIRELGTHGLGNDKKRDIGPPTISSSVIGHFLATKSPRNPLANRPQQGAWHPVVHAPALGARHSVAGCQAPCSCW